VIIVVIPKDTITDSWCGTAAAVYSIVSIIDDGMVAHGGGNIGIIKINTFISVFIYEVILYAQFFSLVAIYPIVAVTFNNTMTDSQGVLQVGEGVGVVGVDCYAYGSGTDISFDIRVRFTGVVQIRGNRDNRLCL